MQVAFVALFMVSVLLLSCHDLMWRMHAGETMKAVGSAPEHSVVRMYSLASSTSFDSLQPTATFAVRWHGAKMYAVSFCLLSKTMCILESRQNAGMYRRALHLLLPSLYVWPGSAV